MQDHANLTGHVLLGVLDERVERLSRRGEPLRIVDQLAPALVDVALDAVLFAFEAAVLKLLMSGNQGHGTRGLVQLAGLDADQAVLDEVDAADALGSGAAVHLFDGLQRSDVTSVDLDRHAFLELDDDFIFDRREGRVVGVGVAVLGRAVPRILKEAGLNGAAPHVLVDGVRGLLGLGDRQLVLLGERNLDVAGQGQVANRADGLQRRVDGGNGDLETNLVVTLAGATVGDGVGTELVGGAHEVLGDQRTGDGGDQRVDAFVHGVGLEGLHAIFVGELVTGVDHVGFDGSAGEGALLDGLKAFAALADVEGHGHDVLAGALLQVRDGDGGVKTAGVGQNNALVICHWFPFVQGLKNELMQVYTEDCIFMHGVLVIWRRGLVASRSGRRRCRHWCRSP